MGMVACGHTGSWTAGGCSGNVRLRKKRTMAGRTLGRPEVQRGMESRTDKAVAEGAVGGKLEMEQGQF